MRGDIAARIGIMVLQPGPADVSGFLEEADALDTHALELNRQANPADAGTGDDDTWSGSQ